MKTRSLGTYIAIGTVLCLWNVPGFTRTACASPPFPTQFQLTSAREDIIVPHPLSSGGVKYDLVYVHHIASGDWVGDWEHSGFMTFNFNASGDLTVVAHAFGTFTGEVHGVSGTLELVATTKVKVSADGSEATGSSNWAILRGTGGLTNLRGQGSELDAINQPGYNEGRLHFAP